MWRLLCIFLVGLHLHSGAAQFDLTQQIFEHVNQQLKGTQDLGQIITQNVHKSLGLDADFGQQIQQNIMNSLKGTENLGSRIAENVNRQLAPLENLGVNIHNQVQQSLAPVYALQIRNNMANGIGGIAIATYSGNRPRSFIIENGVRSVCNGDIQGSQCLGLLQPFRIKMREDFCYATSYASAQNYICLSSGNINVLVSNGNIRCNSNDESPTLLLTRQDYRNLCGNRMPWEVRYKYYANPNDLQAIQIPNSNPYIRCLNNEVGVCEFDGNNSGGSSGTIISSSSGINVNYNYN